MFSYFFESLTYCDIRFSFVSYFYERLSLTDISMFVLYVRKKRTRCVLKSDSQPPKSSFDLLQ